MGRPAKTIKLNNLSAQNAEKAYQILNQVFDKTGKSMFDMMFEMNLQAGIFDKLTEEERSEFKSELMKAEKAGRINDKTFLVEMYEKYPNAFAKNEDFGIEIRKVFLLNEQNMNFAKELSKLFTGEDATDIKEAVGNAFAYIVFLRQV
jgi:hypothetical protein